ncbi:deoxyribose-phosphate aldolase [Planococcus citri]|uniref:deoxyribose-phosphate aldolase n=1 Tax=Planococcus citri TaxID=170843 RepID=UPI0031FA1A72
MSIEKISPAIINMYNEGWLNEVHVNEWTVLERAKLFDQKPNNVYKTLESLLLLKSVTLIDYSTLFGDDSFSNVTALVNKGARPLSEKLFQKALSSVTTSIKNIIKTQTLRKSSVVVSIDTTDDNFNFKVTEQADTSLNEQYGLTDHELIEVKQLLKAFHLHDEKSLSESLAEFLYLGDDSTDCKNETKKTIRVGALCIYPAFVSVVADSLRAKKLLVSSKSTEGSNNSSNGIPIASVAAAFPSGLYPLESKISEINFATRNGATEIDIVISRYLVLQHRWTELFEEIKALKEACGSAKMKTILAVGECGSLENVYKASMVAMMAGTDYIKTSTGKEAVNATFTSGLVMCRAIKNFYIKTGKKIGFKPAGGIRTAEDSLKWINLVITELGADWLSLFRIGASGVLKSIEQRLHHINP